MSCWLKMFIMSTMINVVVKKEWKYIIFISVFLLHIHLINVRRLLYRKSRHTTWQTRYFAVSHQTRLLRSSCRLTVIHTRCFSPLCCCCLCSLWFWPENTHTHISFILHSPLTREIKLCVCLGRKWASVVLGCWRVNETAREGRRKQTLLMTTKESVVHGDPCLVWSGVWFPVYTVRHFTPVPPVCEQEWEECHRCCLWLVEWMGVNEWKECSVNCLEWSSGLERGCISTGHLSF